MNIQDELIDLLEVPARPTVEMFDFLQNPEDPGAALQAVSAIYSVLFWDKCDVGNKTKIEAALQSKAMLARLVKEKGDRGLFVLDALGEMSQRASLLFQMAYERAGLQFMPDENEDVYETVANALKAKINTVTSTGTKSELGWAIDTLIPVMREKGLDVAALLSQPESYTKFRKYVQAVRQRERIVDAVDKRFENEKKMVQKNIKKTVDPVKTDALKKKLVNLEKEQKDKKEIELQNFDTVTRDGLKDVLDPNLDSVDIERKWRLERTNNLDSVGYTAIVSGTKTVLVAEFEYSQLGAIEIQLNNIIDIRGMTDPKLIIKQLREYADSLEFTIAGTKEML